MSSPKNKSMETVSFAQITNPEVLTAQPRPGGAVPIIELHLTPPVLPSVATSTPNPDDEKRSLKDKMSREFRVQSALDDVDSYESVEACAPNPLKDAMYLISIAVSTVAMMATGYVDIPTPHLKMTKLLLETVKDDYGNFPPNVQGLLNHIKMIKPDLGEESQNPPPPADDEF